MKKILIFLLFTAICLYSSAQTQTPNEVIGVSQVVCSGATAARINQVSTNPTNIGGTSIYYRYRYTTSWTPVGSSVSTDGRYQPAYTTYSEYYYRVRESEPDWSTSNRVYLLKNLSLSEGSIAGNQSIPYNATPALLTSAVDATNDILPNLIPNAMTYAWYKSDDVNGYTLIVGATSKDYQPPALTKTTQYKRRAKTACFDKESNVVVVTVYDPLTSGQISANQNRCFNVAPAPIVESTAPTGGSGSLSYQYQVSSDGANFSNILGATSKAYTPDFIVGTRYYRRNTIDAVCGTLPTNIVSVVGYPDVTDGEIQHAQNIIYNTQPQGLSIKTPPVGGDGSGFSTQWQVSTDNSTFTDVSGATSNSYIPPFLTAHRWYRLKSVNPCKTVYTPSIKIHVYPEFLPPIISTSQSICYNTAPSLLQTEIPFSGGSGDNSLQWFGSANGITFSSIAGATSSTYQPAAMTNTMYYQLKVIDVNCGTITSNTIMVEVKPDLTSGQIGSSHSICYDSNPANLVNSTSPTGAFGNYQYQWEVLQGVNWVDIDAATNASYQPPKLLATTLYRRIVTSGTCSEKVSNVVTVTVRNEFLAGSIGSNQTINYGYTPNTLNPITPASGGSAQFSYSWKISTDNITFTNIANATSESYLPSSLYVTTYFQRVTTDLVCGDKTSNVVTISVNPCTFTAGQISANQNLCFNVAPAALVESTVPTGGFGSISYQYQVSTDGANFSNILGATAKTYTPEFIVGTRYYRRNTIDAVCGTYPTNTVSVVGYPDATNGEIQHNQFINYNTQPQVLTVKTAPVGGDGSGFSTQWQVSTDNSTFNDVIGATSNSYIPSILTAHRWYRLKGVNPCKTVYTPSVKVHVYPEFLPPTIKSAQSICFNTVPAALSIDLNFSGGSGSNSLQWFGSSDGITFSSIAGATSSTYQPAALTSTMFYQLKVIDINCGTITSNTVKVEIMPELTSGEIGASQNICFDTNPANLVTTTSPTGAFGNYQYQWEVLQGVNWVDIDAATNASYQPPKLVATTLYRRIVTSGTCSEKVSNVVTVTVRNEFLAGTIGSNQTINFGATPNTLNPITPASGGSAQFSYSWKVSTDNISFTNIANATSESYLPSSLSVTTYFQRVTTDLVCEDKTSNVVTISVNPCTFTAGQISANQNLCFEVAPAPIVESTAITGGFGSISYQYQVSTDGANFSNIFGATAKGYTPEFIVGTRYYRRVSTDIVCGSIPTNSVTVVGYPDATNGEIQPSQFIDYNTQPQILTIKTVPVGGDGSGFLYQWQVSTDNSTFTDVPSALGSTYIPPVLLSHKWYRLKAVNPCKTVFSPSIKIHVYDELKPAKIIGTQSICYNTIPSLLSVEENSTGGSGSNSLQWCVSVNGVNFSNIPNATTSTYQPAALTNTMYYQLNVIDTYSGTAKSNIVKVEVMPDLYGGLIGTTQEICYDTNPSNLITTANPTGAFGNYQYQWEVLQGVNWVDISGETNANYQPPKLVATSIYRRLASSGACGSKYSNVVTISVKNEFLAGSVGSNQTINYGYTPNIFNTISPARGGSATFSYKWQLSSDNITFTNILGATNESYQSGALYDTTYFRRITTDLLCGDKFSNVVIVNVNLSLNGGSISDNQTICFDSRPAKITGTAATGGFGTFAYKWFRSNNNSTYDEVIGATEKDYQPNNLTQSIYLKRQASLGGQSVESNKVFIEVRPAMIEPTTDLKGRYCLGSTASISIVGAEVGMKYNWYNSANVQILIGTQLNLNNFTNDTDVMIEKEDAIGCRSTKKLLNLKVDEVKAQFTADKTTILQGEMVSFTNSSLNGSTYAWSFGDGVNSTEAAPSYYYQKLDNMSKTLFDVSLVVTSPYGCNSSEFKTRYITVNPTATGVDDEKMIKVKFYPSPFSSSLTVSSALRIENLEIFSLTGQKLYSILGEENSLTVNLSQLPKGIYIARVKTVDGSSIINKIVKAE